MSLILRKELACLDGKRLHVYDGWDGKNEGVVFGVIGPRGGEQGMHGMTREDAADFGRALIALYAEEGEE